VSTILDALKKSEKERKLNDLPTLSDMPAPKEQSQWPQIAIISLLVLLLIVLVVLLSRSWDSTDNAQAKAVKNIVITNDSVAASTSGESTENGVIKVDVVSYAENPEQRFAMINGKMTRESEFVRAGLKVQEIKPNSVILIERGRRIELSP